MIFERHANLKYKFENGHFWAEGYYVSTVVLRWLAPLGVFMISTEIICSLQNLTVSTKSQNRRKFGGNCHGH